MFEEIPIMTILNGTQEPPSDQITSRPSPKMGKGKAKMPDYEDNQFNDNESTHSLDNFDLPIMRTPGVKKAISIVN